MKIKDKREMSMRRGESTTGQKKGEGLKERKIRKFVEETEPEEINIQERKKKYKNIKQNTKTKKYKKRKMKKIQKTKRIIGNKTKP